MNKGFVFFFNSLIMTKQAGNIKAQSFRLVILAEEAPKVRVVMVIMSLHNILDLKSLDHGVTTTLRQNFFKYCWLSKLRCGLSKLLLKGVKAGLKWRTPSAFSPVRINKAKSSCGPLKMLSYATHLF